MAKAKTRILGTGEFAGRAGVTVPTVQKWCRMIVRDERSNMLAYLRVMHGLERVTRDSSRRWRLHVRG